MTATVRGIGNIGRSFFVGQQQWPARSGSKERLAREYVRRKSVAPWCRRFDAARRKTKRTATRRNLRAGTNRISYVLVRTLWLDQSGPDNLCRPVIRCTAD